MLAWWGYFGGYLKLTIQQPHPRGYYNSKLSPFVKTISKFLFIPTTYAT